jgi:hypothetical protein
LKFVFPFLATVVDFWRKSEVLVVERKIFEELQLLRFEERWEVRKTESLSG